MNLHRTFRFFTSLLLIGTLGCSGESKDFPELIPVTGTVMLDGKPLAGATLDFEPETGPASMAETDETGHYEVIYKIGVKGAVTGTHTVRISKNTSEDKADVSGEIVPAKYNLKSELTATVKQDGENNFDFDLKSK